MHKARAFFYVAAGIFLLALSYHLGARNAGAQGPAIEAVSAALGFNAIVGRTVYTAFIGGGAPVTRPPVPGTAAVVAVDGNPSGNQVLLANGEGYQYQVNVGWVLTGNLFGPTSAAQRESFGSVKSRYRGERGATQPTPQGR